MKLAIILDPLDSLKIYKDSTFAMMREAAKRGHEIFALMQKDLALRDGVVIGLAQALTLTGSATDWYRASATATLPLNQFDAVLMRKDPPFDLEYLYSTHLLELAEKQGTKVFNKPRALRDFNEKLVIANFSEFTAPTLVSCQPQLILEFLVEHRDIILKPLDGMGGSSIFRVTPSDPNQNVIIETLTQLGTRTIMAQRYIPAISQGDKRILLIDGVAVPYALARIPKAGETRGNLAAGGTGVAQPLSTRDREIAESLGPRLRDLGLLLVGLDVIGEYLTEINVTSPTCFQEITEQTQFNVAAMMIDAVEKGVRLIFFCARNRNALLALASLLLCACAKEPLYQQQSYVFGTLVEITIYGETETRAHELASHVFADFDRMHREMHPWKPGAMADINRAFAQSPMRAKIAADLVPVIRNATKISLKSDGLFNPAIGKLVELWGFHNDEFKSVRPSPEAIAKLVKAHPQMPDIVIDGSEIFSKNPAVQLDLGGYAKGYALDRASEYLHAAGVRGALVNIGGNIIAIGRKGNTPWRVGIQHPRQSGSLATLVLEDGEAIGTSGDYQRYFMLDGKRYCHIIDPRTGYPAQGVEAVTVLIPKGPMAGTLSDAASKPIFISGVEHWREAARQMGVVAAMLIAENGEIYITSALKKRLDFSDTTSVIHENAELR